MDWQNIITIITTIITVASAGFGIVKYINSQLEKRLDRAEKLSTKYRDEQRENINKLFILVGNTEDKIRRDFVSKEFFKEHKENTAKDIDKIYSKLDEIKSENNRQFERINDSMEKLTDKLIEYINKDK